MAPADDASEDAVMRSKGTSFQIKRRGGEPVRGPAHAELGVPIRPGRGEGTADTPKPDEPKKARKVRDFGKLRRRAVWALPRLLILSLVLGFLYFIWPTPWVYTTVNDAGPGVVLIKRNRFTGEIQVYDLTESGSAVVSPQPREVRSRRVRRQPRQWR